MDRLKEYKIAYRGLNEGRHIFRYVLDRAFFDCFETTKGIDGKVEATAEIVKSTLLMEVRLKIQGSVKAVCDRCLGKMEMTVEGEMNVYAKPGSREEGNEDDFIVLAPDEDFLDLSTYFYEVYMLNYPIRVVHPEGQCDAAMEDVLGKYVLKEEEKPVDPRWDELRKLINN